MKSPQGVDTDERVCVQGEFEGFPFHGTCCCVRWSYKGVFFEGVEAFAERLRRCLPQVKEFYGGKVKTVEDGGVLEEYVAVLVFKGRGTKRINPDLSGFLVSPKDGDVENVRSNCRMVLRLPKSKGGSHLYRKMPVRWCGMVKRECGFVFGDERIGWDDMGLDENEGRAEVEEDVGCDTPSVSEVVVVESESERVGGGPGGGMVEGLDSIGSFSYLLRSRGIDKMTVPQLKAYHGLLQAELNLKLIEYQLAQLGVEGCGDGGR
jgi:hypothetical protein